MTLQTCCNQSDAAQHATYGVRLCKCSGIYPRKHHKLEGFTCQLLIAFQLLSSPGSDTVATADHDTVATADHNNVVTGPYAVLTLSRADHGKLFHSNA